MAGTIPLSMTQQFDVYGAPLAGGQLYIIQVGTVSTPQNAYSDTGLSIALPYPMTLDAAGRVPQFFLADGSVKIRLQDRAGVVQLAADSVLVIGPSGGGGGGGSTVDPTQLIQTGDMMFSHSTATRAGFVRLNAKTIGSATSGATERANADTQALFLFLWPDATLAVSGGRGGTAAADWAANKQLSLPDWRGYALSGLDDMGNTAAGRLTATYFGTVATNLGAVGGVENTVLSAAQLPAVTPTGSVTIASNTMGGTIPVRQFAAGASDPLHISLAGSSGADAGLFSITPTGTMTFTLTMNALGSGQGHRTIGPRKLVTFFMKL